MERRMRRRRPGRKKPKALAVGAAIMLALLGAAGLFFALRGQPSALERLKAAQLPAWVDVQIIEVDGASRRGVPLDELNGIVVHYVGNPGTSAQQNHDFFAGPDSEVSSHFIIGLDGEVIQCVPLDEKSSASNERNRDTISIEVCHPDVSGAFTEASYAALVELTAWLCQSTGLGGEAVIRHYDVTGKLCPLYYVEHEDAWLRFKEDVAARVSA